MSGDPVYVEFKKSCNKSNYIPIAKGIYVPYIQCTMYVIFKFAQLIWGYKRYILDWNNWVIGSQLYKGIEPHNQFAEIWFGNTFFLEITLPLNSVKWFKSILSSFHWFAIWLEEIDFCFGINRNLLSQHHYNPKLNSETIIW